MAAGAGLFESGPVVARDSLSRTFLRSGVLCPVRGNLGEVSYVRTTSGSVLNGAIWSLVEWGQRR